MEEILIVGYGRMGKEIEQQTVAMGLKVHAIADSYQQLEELGRSGKLSAAPSLVAIEFTGGTASAANLKYLLERDIPVVCGSTPWDGGDAEGANGLHSAVLQLLRERRGYLIYSSNYSIGVHIFWRIVRQASHLLDSFTQYDLAVHEQHHNHKVDAPSGTAINTGQIVLQEVERKSRLLCGQPQGANGNSRPIAPEELQVSSQRLGHVPGVHQLLCDSPEDSIAICHSARNRSGFARGAILAAQFLQQQYRAGESGFFSMDDLMDYFLSRQVQTP